MTMQLWARYQDGTRLDMAGTQADIENGLRWMGSRGKQLRAVSVRVDEHTHRLSPDPTLENALALIVLAVS